MEMTTLGSTDLRVSRLGVGLAEIGSADYASAEGVLNAALDGGINFLDTAACYGDSEEWVGRAVAHRRDEFVLATKAGHATAGYEGEPWTRQTILDSIDRSLRRLRTDRVDLVQLHSCDLETLRRGKVVEALQDARRAGKTRFIGYSGDDEAAAWAVESGHFDTLQTTYNLVAQRARLELLPKADAAGMGIIIKRPIANAAWSGRTRNEAYRERARQMAEMGPIPSAPEDPILLSLGFTLACAEVDVAIVGTRNPEHMRQNIRLAEEGLPISAHVVEELYHRFERLWGR